MIVLRSIDVDALIRTLFGIQATLVAGSITGVIYLLARWREALKTMRTTLDVPQNIEVAAFASQQLKLIEIRTLRAKAFVLIVPLITVAEVFAYYLDLLPGEVLIIIMLLLYIFEVIYLVTVIGPPSLTLRVRLDVKRDD